MVPTFFLREQETARHISPNTHKHIIINKRDHVSYTFWKLVTALISFEALTSVMWAVGSI